MTLLMCCFVLAGNNGQCDSSGACRECDGGQCYAPVSLTLLLYTTRYYTTVQSCKIIYMGFRSIPHIHALDSRQQLLQRAPTPWQARRLAVILAAVAQR